MVRRINKESMKNMHNNIKLNIQFWHEIILGSIAQRNEKILTHEKGFTMAEMLITMMVITILMVVSLPAITQLLTAKAGTDKNTMVCITDGATSWYTDATGDTDTSGLAAGSACLAAVTDVQYNRGRALNTAKWYATQGTGTQPVTAKRILRAACDNGGAKACDYFINVCQTDLNACDDPSDFTDLAYYLHQNSTNPTADVSAEYISEKLEKLLPKQMSNLITGTIQECNENQLPEDLSAEQNLNSNKACDISAPFLIKTCNEGDSSACELAYHLAFNKSCVQIYNSYDEDVPSGEYTLTYSLDGGVNVLTQTLSKCRMKTEATAAISGCDTITEASPELLVNNTPDDDCTYGFNNNYNRTCSEIMSHDLWEPLHNLTEDPANLDVFSMITENYGVNCGDAGGGGGEEEPPPGHECMTVGNGPCPDGTYFIGYHAGHYYFTTPTDSGERKWQNVTSCPSDVECPFLGAINHGMGRYGDPDNYNLIPEGSDYPAENVCKLKNIGLGAYKHTDWFLPSLDELEMLSDAVQPWVSTGNYIRPGTDFIYLSGDAAFNFYYTSSEIDYNHAWAYSIVDHAARSFKEKFYYYYVRCVRKSTDTVPPP